MFYSVTLVCGCVVYVSCHPLTGVAHTRIVEQRGQQCRIRSHDVGTRVWLWEMLPPMSGATANVLGLRWRDIGVVLRQ